MFYVQPAGTKNQKPLSSNLPAPPVGPAPRLLARSLHERPVHRQVLPVQVVTVHGLQRVGGLLQRLVLYQAVALDVAGAAVQVEVDALQLAELPERVQDVLLLGLLVDVGDEQDPAFHRPGRPVGAPVHLHGLVLDVPLPVLLRVLDAPPLLPGDALLQLLDALVALLLLKVVFHVVVVQIDRVSHCEFCFF